MNYFALELSLDEQIMGTYFQAKDYKHNCHVYDDPSFIGQFTFKKVDIDPILSNPIVDSSARITDIIRVSSVGFPPGSMVISDKLKSIIESSKHYGIQFFPTFLIKNNEKITGYWQSHVYDFPYQYIDFANSSFILKDRDVNRKVIISNIQFNHENEFLSFSKEIEYPKMLYCSKVVFLPDMSLDYFYFGYLEDHNGIVSEKLKNAIENMDVRGIEFRPIELSLQEWMHSGARAAVYGKI